MDLYSNLRRYQVYPIKLNSEQLEALSLGAEKLWFPLLNEALDQYSNADDLGHNFVWEDPEHIGHWISGVELFSPLQPNEDYFVHRVNNTYNPGTKQMARTLGNAIKFKVTGVKIKRCKELDDYWQELNPDGAGGMNDMWLNRQYPEQPYSSNPHGFLVTIQRID